MKPRSVPYDQLIHLRTAHDVRHMRPCDICKGIVDKRHALPIRANVYVHGRCYIAQWGIGQMLQLPETALNSLTLGDIGGNAMKAIIDRFATKEK